jgi:hypothetical protein
MVTIQSDWEPMLKELNRLEKVVNNPSRPKLDIILEKQFAKTQMDVHVITSSLKQSGKKSSTVRGRTWTGRISYGGASTGPRPVVNYAIYERERTGSHDYMRGVMDFHFQYVNTIKELLKDG